MAGKILLQQALQKPYERRVFITEILQPVFQNKLQIPTLPINETPNLTQSETSLIKQVLRYGNITLDDDTDIVCYEITLHDAVRLEQNRISIQQYVRKLMVAGDVMLLSFVQQKSPNSWRLSLVASDTKVSDTGEIKAIKTNAKRYTYLLGQAESCLTAALQLAILESKSIIERKDLIEAFAVEKVSKPFFDEYTKIHYKRFNDYLMASNFKAAVFNGDEKAMRDFVKKLLGRIVFLYFVQKKGWLGSKPDFMMQLFKTSGGNETFYPLWLSELFFNALNAPRPNDAFVMPDKTVLTIPFLNGGLFEKDKHDEHFLTFPPQFFHNTDNAESDKERGFLDFLNAYNFTVYEDSPDDHTVAVDPEMLGHIFENLLEDNKDKGAFYTPKEIVHYMCQESLIEYLATKPTPPPSGKIELGKTQADLFGNDSRKGQLPMEADIEDKALPKVQRTDIEELIKHQKISEGLRPHLKTISHKLETVRICDPAIGSGAFPMGLLHEIFNAKILLHQAIEGVSPTPKQRVEMKLHIIQNSIYGVDIERGAVDIARLRFWLSLIVDEQTPKALPNLDYKIVVGNSLVSKFEDEVISIDWDRKLSAGKAHDFVQNIQRLLKEVADKQKQYFDAEVSKKQALTSKIRALKLELLINQFSFNKDKYMNTTPQLGAMFPTAKEIKANTERLLTIANFDNQIKKLQTLQQHPERPFLHFDWKLDFPEVLNPHLVAENGGFDIVIGNPPYVDIKAIDSEMVKMLFLHFKSAVNRINLYSIFIEKGINILAKNGIMSYIIPNSLLVNESYIKVRELLVNGIQSLIKLPDAIFENAIVETIIFSFKNSIINDKILGKYYPNNYKTNLQNIDFQHFDRNVWINDNEKRFNIFGNEHTSKVIEKIDKISTKLADFADFSLGITPYDKYKGHTEEDMNNKIFHSKIKKDDSYVPLISGGNVVRFCVNEEKSDGFLKYGSWLGAARESRFFKEPRIIVRQIVSGKPLRIFAGYTEKELYFTQIGFGIISKTIDKKKTKYLCAILNSNLMNFYHSFKYLDIEKEIFQKILIVNCKKFPIPVPSQEVETQLETLVNQILIDKKLGKNTEVLEAEIDALVYALYELTAAEIAVVEGR